MENILRIELKLWLSPVFSKNMNAIDLRSLQKLENKEQNWQNKKKK